MVPKITTFLLCLLSAARLQATDPLPTQPLTIRLDTGALNVTSGSVSLSDPAFGGTLPFARLPALGVVSYGAITSLSAAGSTSLTRGGKLSFDGISLSAGSGTYTAVVILPHSSAVQGDRWTIKIGLPASTNPTLVISDATAGQIAIIAGTGTAKIVALQFTYNGAYWLADNGAPPALLSDLPASVTGLRKSSGAGSTDTVATLGIDYGHGYASRSKGDVLRVLTAADLRTLAAPGTIALTAAQTTVPSGSKAVVFDGDSITYGLQATSGQGAVTGTVYPAIAMTALGTGWSGYNVGVSGHTIEQRTSAASSAVDSHYSSGNARNVVAILIGTNNFYGAGVDNGVGGAASAFGKLQTYVAARQAVGWEVYVGTVPPFLLTGQPELNRLEYNARIRAVYGDHVLDYAATLMGAANTSTYYGADNAHPNDTGYALMGATAAGRMQPASGALAPPTYGARVSLLGVASGTDGAAVELFYDPGCFAADDGAAYFCPTSVASTAAGRWRKVGTNGTASGGGNLPVVYTWSGSGTYTVPDDADVVTITGNFNAGTLTLPAASTRGIGVPLMILTQQQAPVDFGSGYALTVQRAGSDVIYGFGNQNSVTSLLIGGPGSVIFYRGTTSRWIAPQVGIDAQGLNLNLARVAGSAGNSFIGFTGNALNLYGLNGVLPAQDGTLPLGTSAKRWASLSLSATLSAAGSTGNKTISTAQGSVRIAAGASSVVVTNASATTATKFRAVQVQSNDSTAKSAVAVPAAGNFTITLNAAATAETEVYFEVASY